MQVLQVLQGVRWTACAHPRQWLYARVLCEHLHTSAYVSIRQRTPPAVALCARPLPAPARRHGGRTTQDAHDQHTSAYVSIRQHTSAYVSIRQRLYLRGAMEAARCEVRVN